MSVDIGEYVELSFVIADTWSPYALAICLFAVGESEFVSHIQTVEGIAKKFPVDKVFGMQYDEPGHTMHCSARHIEVFPYTDNVRVRKFIIEKGIGECSVSIVGSP